MKWTAYPVTALIVVLLAGCGGTASKSAAPVAPKAKPAASPSTPPKQAAAAPAAPTAPAAAKPLTDVTVDLSWLVTPTEAPLALAQVKGYYRAAGLKVKIVQGRSNNVAAQLVAKGGPVIGEGAIGSYVPSIAKGVPIKAVAAYLHKSPIAFIYHKSSRFSGPKSLLHLTIVTSPGAPPWELLPAILSKYGIKKSQLHPQFVSSSLEHSLFLKNSDTIQMAYIDGNNGLRDLSSPGVGYKLYADYGINLYDIGLVASDSLIKSDPALVQKFVSATTKAWHDAITNPKDASLGIDALLKQYPHNNAKLFELGWKTALGLLVSPGTRGKPLGWMAPSEMRSQLDILHTYAGMPLKPAADFYTNRFVSGG